MKRVVSLLRQDGIIPVLDGVFSRARSHFISQRWGYSPGFVMGYSTQWLGGKSIRVGSNFRIGKRGRVEMIHEHNGRVYIPALSFGENVSINDDVHIACAFNITIGNDVLMASKIFISDHNHGMYVGDNSDTPNTPPGKRFLNGAPISIGDRVWLGEMVSILPGVTIGAGAIIGSNSVVTQDIPENCIAVGTPARVIKRFVSEHGEWLRVSD